MLELEKLFGSSEIVKLIRFFVAHPDRVYEVDEISEHTKIKTANFKLELNDLVASTLVIKSKERVVVQKPATKNKKATTSSKEAIVYKLNNSFRFLETLSDFVFDFKNANRDVLFDKFKNLGRTKAFVLSGVFTGTEKARTDILYVAEALRTSAVEKVVSDVRAEIGKPITITVLDLEEFNYRYKMYDRFIRDAINESHETIVDKLGLF